MKDDKAMEHSDNGQNPSLDANQQTGWLHSSERADAPDTLLPNFLDRLGLGNESILLWASVDQLKVALDSQEWPRRVAAVRALGKLGERMPLELLERALKDENGFVRAAAMQALGRLGERAPIELLEDALKRDPEWRVRAAAALVLGELGALGKQEPIKLLVASLKNDKDASVRVVAAGSLGRLGERAPIELLEDALKRDPEWRVREAAVLALGELGQRVPKKIFVDAWHDVDITVRKASEQVLQQLHPDVFPDTSSSVTAHQPGLESGMVFGFQPRERLESPEQDDSASRHSTYQSEPTELGVSAAHLRRAPQTFSRCKQVAPGALRSFGRAVNLAFAVLFVVGLIASALFLFRHSPTTTTGGANATATALATAINRASTPQDIYTVLTSSSPVLNDPLSSQDANRWDEYATTNGGCKFTGGTYHSYVLRPYVAECYAQTKSFPQTTIFALQVQVTLIKGDGGGGLIFGYRGENLRYYRFVVRSDGYFDLYDPWTQRQLPYGTNSAFKSNPGQSNQLTVIVRNSIMYLYINGTYIGQASMEADTSVSGGIGLFSVNGQQNPTEVGFHDMKVWVIR
jgi:HEAT repeat protein